MRGLLGTALLAALITACSSAPVTMTGKKVDTALIHRKYASQISTAFEGDRRVENCPTQKVLEADKNWRSIMAKANGCINKSQWSMVELAGERLSQVEPDAPWGAYYLSVAAENRGHIERALWMIDLALKKATNVGVLRYQRGRILWKQEFFKEAIAEMQKAIDLDKNIKDAHLFLGQVYLRELDFKKAQMHFEAVLLLEARNQQALFGLANCHIEQDKTQEAISVIERGISNFPRVLDFRLQEVYVYENLIKDANITLAKYKQLQNLMSSKKVDGTLPFNIQEKIKVLEDVTQKTRQLASKETEKKK